MKYFFLIILIIGSILIFIKWDTIEEDQKKFWNKEYKEKQIQLESSTQKESKIILQQSKEKKVTKEERQKNDIQKNISHDQRRNIAIIDKSEYMIPSFPDIKNELSYQQGEDKGYDSGYKLEATAKSWREAAWSNYSNWEKAYNKLNNYNNEVKNLVNKARTKFGYVSWASKLESFNQSASESFKNLFYAYCNMKNAYSNFDSSARHSWSLITTKTGRESDLKAFSRSMEEGGAEWNRGVNHYKNFKRTLPVEKFNNAVDDWNGWDPN